MQVVIAAVLVTALCDLGYTVYKDKEEGEGGVAQFLYFSSAMLASSMASSSYMTHTYTLIHCSVLRLQKGSLHHVCTHVYINK